jgi:hypothetical protein
MSQFRTKLFFEDDAGLPYTLIAPLVYQSDVLKRDVIVPEGFETDLASIPRGLWNILPKSAGYDKAAVIHDYLYAMNGVTRKQADDVLYEAMGVLNVNGAKKRLVYWGVRVGGGPAWDGHRKKDPHVETVR